MIDTDAEIVQPMQSSCMLVKYLYICVYPMIVANTRLAKSPMIMEMMAFIVLRFFVSQLKESSSLQEFRCGILASRKSGKAEN